MTYLNLNLKIILYFIIHKKCLQIKIIKKKKK